MASGDAWQMGWDKGSAAAGKRKGKGKKQGSAKTAQSAKAAAGGGNPWSILSVLKKSMGGTAKPASYDKGGKVRKTGIARVRKGEVVLTAAQAKQCAAKKGMSKSGARKRISAKRS